MKLSGLSGKAEDAAAYLSALANAKRLQILAILLEGERSVGVLADMVSLSQSALSQHLAKLRAQALVRTRREGQTIFYMLDCARTPEFLALLQDIIEDMQNSQAA